MQPAYYNENDPNACAWLGELQKQAVIKPGKIDPRSICDVKAEEIANFRTVHLFAGIGGWDYALTLADWPEEREIFTVSCPCQPFSVQGTNGGLLDERHLWPVVRNLIAQRRPAIVVGEQVASKDGRAWLAGVRFEMERMGYAFGGADLCAAGVRAPQIRQRLYWIGVFNGMAYSQNNRLAWKQKATKQNGGRQLAPSGSIDGVGNPDSIQDNTSESGQSVFGARCHPAAWNRQRVRENLAIYPKRIWETFEVVPCRDGSFRRTEPGTFPLSNGVSSRVGRLRGYGNAIVPDLAAEFIKAYLETEKQ